MQSFNRNYKVFFVNILFHGTSIILTIFSICKLKTSSQSHTRSSWPDACKCHRPSDGKPPNMTRIGGRCRSEVLIGNAPFTRKSVKQKHADGRMPPETTHQRPPEGSKGLYNIMLIYPPTQFTNAPLGERRFIKSLRPACQHCIHRPAYRAVVGIVV